MIKLPEGKPISYKFDIQGYGREDGEKKFMTLKPNEVQQMLEFFRGFEKIEIKVYMYYEHRYGLTIEKMFSKDNGDKFNDIKSFVDWIITSPIDF